MSRQIEVLAPAGSMEVLRTAISAGADAVYVGGVRFGARAYADNFDEETLVSAIQYAHLHDVKLYLTVNTLFVQEELEQLYDFLKRPYEEGLDAVIVQDIGVAAYIRRQFPKLPLHVSTQMTIANATGGALLKELGAVRIVPARELSIAELSELKERLQLEIEVFVHGALCYCYSGQCLFSSMLGGRSGNRGRCAQPCRLPYQLDSDENTTGYHGEPYLLSPKDLCALDYLPQLIAAGVDSLKIEGRMKNSSYVAAAVSSYKKAVAAIADGAYDSAFVSGLKKQMAEIYNRGGFTEGYFEGYRGRGMMSMARPNHAGVRLGEIRKISKGTVTFLAEADIGRGDVLELALKDGSKLELTSPLDYEKGSIVCLNASKTKLAACNTTVYRTKNAAWLKYLTEQYIENEKKEKVKIEVILKKHSPAKMYMIYQGSRIGVQGEMVAKAEKQPLTRDIVLDKVSRLGNTPFIAEDIQLDMEDDVFLPVKALNELRRMAVESMTLCLSSHPREPVERIQPKTPPVKSPQVSDFCLSAYCCNEAVLDTVLEFDEIATVYLDTLFMEDIRAIAELRRIKRSGKSVILCTPHIFRRDMQKLFTDFLSRLEPEDYDGIMARTMDSFGFLVEQKQNFRQKRIIGDASLYAYNAEAAAYYRQYFPDMEFVMPRELSFEKINALRLPNLICDIYGNQPVMVSAQCMQRNVDACSRKNILRRMTDRKHVGYDVQSVCKYCYN
ncbi:MAG: U32 family peptidase, partial [Lachnospiraceae bacterium]|nr:U32 family peptidase [Lachnospiraceae bacterium]